MTDILKTQTVIQSQSCKWDALYITIHTGIIIHNIIHVHIDEGGIILHIKYILNER